jgi:two-component system, OmpR family, response regulator
MKILLLEDDDIIAQHLSKGLKEAGYVVVHERDGGIGYKMICKETFDLGIFDIMLPSMDGLKVLEKMRQQNIQTPILILSAKNTTEDIVKGIQAGGDDYMVKPFSFAELCARCQGLLRRSQHITSSDLICGDLKVDLLTHQVSRGHTVIQLQPMEYALLVYLLRKKGQVISKTTIMESVWDYNFDPQTNIVESRICRLREKVDEPFSKALIHTVRGFGYCLKDSD